MVAFVEMQLTFEWDEKKAQENAKKHSVTFEEAKTVFGDPLLWTFSDPDHSPHEERYVSIGLSCEGRTLVVVHTDHESIVRIISGRRAEPKERRAYEEERH